MKLFQKFSYSVISKLLEKYKIEATFFLDQSMKTLYFIQRRSKKDNKDWYCKVLDIETSLKTRSLVNIYQQNVLLQTLEQKKLNNL